MSRFCLNVKLWLKPERVDDFLRVILEDRQRTLELEPTCKQFTVGKSTKEENVFFLHEEYDDRAAFDAHLQTPHFFLWKQFCESDPFTQPEQVDFFNEIQ